MELEELQSELKAANATIQTLAPEATKEDAPKEVLEQFDAAIAKHDELSARFKAQQESQEAKEQRAMRQARATEIAEWTGKFEQDTLRNPAYGRQQAKLAEKYRNEPDTYRADVDMAIAAWTLGSTPADLPTDMVEAAKRVNVNPAAKALKPNAYIRQDVQAAVMSQALRANDGRASFRSNSFEAAITTYADSRDDSVLGLTNRAPSFVQQIATTMISYGGILKAPISIETVQDYEDIIETYLTDQNTGRQIGEANTIGTNVNPTNGQIIWKNWDYTSDDITVTERQLKRSRMELPSWIAEALGERLGRTTSDALSDGAGAANPHGIIPATIAGGKVYTTLVTNVIGLDDIHSGMPFAIDEIFRSGSAVGWMMSEPNLQYLMTIKDTTGQPIFNIGFEGNSRLRTLEGWPVYVNREMITTHATTNKPILFGDFSRYKVVYRESAIPTLIRDETTNRRTLKVIFTALVNFDARLRDYGNCPIGYMAIL